MIHRLNVLYLHSHDTGREISPYGAPVDTPHLQALADRGMIFRRAFCASPTCSPSRAALLTGRYAHCNGMTRLAHLGGELDDRTHLLPHFLRERGYETVLAGVQHVEAGHHDADMRPCGYERDLRSLRDEALREAGTPDPATVAVAVDFLRGDRGDRPFFLDVGFFTTHRTAKPSPGAEAWHNGPLSPLGDPRRVRPPAGLPDTPETRADTADFHAAVGRLDRYMGAVLAALDEAGLAENTLVVCTTDHGLAFPGMKCNLNDRGTGVMLTLAGCGFGGGRVSDSLVSHVDVFPTVCDAIGTEPPAWLQGVSLASLGADAGTRVREEVFSEINHHAAPEPVRSVRTDRHRYVRRFRRIPGEEAAAGPGPVLANCDNSVSKTRWMRSGWEERDSPAEALYDLEFDPAEAQDLSEDPAYRSTLDGLRARLDRWMDATDDPLRGVAAS